MASSTAFLSAVNLSFHPVHRWALGWVRLAAAAPLDSSVASLSVPSHSSFSASQSRQRFSDISGDSDWALVQKAVATDSMAISEISADVAVATTIGTGYREQRYARRSTPPQLGMSVPAMHGHRTVLG